MIGTRGLASAALAIAAGVVLISSGTRLSAASFTAVNQIGSNALAVDALRNYFSVVPGAAVQAGTSTPVAAGGVDSLSLTFGLVPSARTFTDVFRVTNLTGQPQTAVLTVSGVAQISSAVFASSGTGTATLAPGATSAVSVTTSSTVAGRGSGTVRLRLAGLSWLYRDYQTTIDEAPEAPTGVSATARPAGRIDVAWSATTTTTNLAGYDIYRSSGSGFVKVNGAILTGTSYSDTATTNGTTYTYRLRAVSSGTPSFESLDSSTASATADATPPPTPSAVALGNGGGTGNAYINAANVASVSVNVTFLAGSLTSDVVTVRLTDGPHTVTQTGLASSGAGTVTFTGLDAQSLNDGSITISAFSTDLAGNVSGTLSATVTKDTVAPGAPTASYNDRNNSTPDRITGTAEAGATVTAVQTAPVASGPYTTTAAGNGSYTLNVAATAGSPGSPITVVYLVTATDAAGNTSAATTVTFAVTK